MLLTYYVAASPLSVSHLVEADVVVTLTEMRYETDDIVDARTVNLSMLLALSYLVDDTNYDVIIPDEGGFV